MIYPRYISFFPPRSYALSTDQLSQIVSQNLENVSLFSFFVYVNRCIPSERNRRNVKLQKTRRRTKKGEKKKKSGPIDITITIFHDKTPIRQQTSVLPSFQSSTLSMANCHSIGSRRFTGSIACKLLRSTPTISQIVRSLPAFSSCPQPSFCSSITRCLIEFELNNKLERDAANEVDDRNVRRVLFEIAR